MRVYTEVKVELVENSNAPTNPLLNENNQIFAEMSGVYKSLFINYDAAKYDLTAGEFGDILVVTTARDEDAIADYITWKQEKGFNVTKEVVATGTNVKSLIQDAYDNNNDLLYVQLVGDWADIKCDLGGGANAPKDPMLGCVVGTDIHPDISIGRFSANNPTHVTIQVEKAINYEKNADMSGDWYESAIGIGSDEGSGNGDDGEMDKVHIQNIYDNKLDPFTYNTNHTNYAPGASAGNLANNVNEGASIINYCGHGSETTFVTTGFSNSNVNQLTNGDKLPVILSVACVNGAFHNSSDCFAEAWLKKENGGAVITWMSTINQPWQPPMRGQDYFNDLLIGGYDYSLHSGQNGINTEEQRTHWGSLAVNAACLMLTESSGGSDVETVETWTTFGDASMQLRTAIPTVLASSNSVMLVGADFETTISAGGSPVEGATVCLSQNGEYVTAITDATGIVSIPNNFTPSDVLLVVTAFNTSTIYETIQCIPPTGPYVIFDAVEVNDDNGQLDYYDGPTDLNFTMKNVGISVANNVVVTITSTDSYITIIDGSADFGNIENGASVTVEDAFKVEVAGNVPEGHPISFDVVAAGDENWESAFTLVAHSADLQYEGFTIDDASGNNNSQLDPGETAIMIVEIKNNGSADAFNVEGVLSNLDNEVIVVTTSPQVFGDILGSESATASFVVTAADVIPAGHISTLELDFTADYGFEGSTQIDIEFGDYCYPEANCTMGDGLDGFAIADISNLNNGCSPNGYGDYTAMSTDLMPGDSYEVTVQTAYSNQQISLWIDFNDDKTFSNDERLVDDYAAASTGNHTFDIDIPADAVNGARRLRVRGAWNGSASDPCEDLTYGETEDYTVVIDNGVVLPMPENLTGSAVSDDVTLEWDAPSAGAPNSYQISRNGGVIASNVNELTYLDEGVPQGSIIYSVKAVYTEGTSAGAGPLVIDVTYTVPENVSATNSNYDVSVVWDAVGAKEILGYNIYRDNVKVNSDVLGTPEFAETLSEDGTYCYTVTTVYTAGESAKSDEDCVTITVGVYELEKGSVSIYPNPATDVVNVNSNQLLERVRIFSIAGQVIYDNESQQNSYLINTSTLESGVYFIQINVNGESIIDKLVVK